MPAPPPAMRFVAAEAGFLPDGPAVDLADIVGVVSDHALAMRGALGKWCLVPSLGSWSPTLDTAKVEKV